MTVWSIWRVRLSISAQYAANWIVYGFSVLVVVYIFALSDYLWEAGFFKKCLILALALAAAGVILEFTKAFDTETGLTLLVTFMPLVFVVNYQTWRRLFIHRYGTEPYLTSPASMIGGVPLGLFDSTNIKGKKRQFDKDRRIKLADFIFSFAVGMIPALIAILAIYAIREFNR